MGFLVRKAILAVEEEAVEGTAETLVDADAFLCMNPVPAPGIESFERDVVRPKLSRYASCVGKRQAGLTFGVELKGSGVAGDVPEWRDLILACGFAETVVGGVSVTYKPASSSVPSATLAAYLDNQSIYKMWGARGNVVLNGNVGEPMMMEYDFLGADFSYVDGVFLSPTFQTAKPQTILNASFVIDGESFVIQSLSLDIANQIELRESVNALSGHVSAIIGDREPVGSMNPELLTVASYDIHGKWRSGAEGAMSIVIGATAGNIATITAPKVQYEEITYGDRAGQRILDVNFRLNRNAGDDELVIALT